MSYYDTIVRVIFLCLGLLGVVSGLTAKEFYARAFGVGDRSQTIPRWFGRLWFVVWGSIFVCAGITGSVPVLVIRVITVVIGAALAISGSLELLRLKASITRARVFKLSTTLDSQLAMKSCKYYFRTITN
jgi:hypothetical protein